MSTPTMAEVILENASLQAQVRAQTNEIRRLGDHRPTEEKALSLKASRPHKETVIEFHPLLPDLPVGGLSREKSEAKCRVKPDDKGLMTRGQASSIFGSVWAKLPDDEKVLYQCEEEETPFQSFIRSKMEDNDNLAEGAQVTKKLASIYIAMHPDLGKKKSKRGKRNG